MKPEEQKKVDNFTQELTTLLKKYNFKMGGVPLFPVYKILPKEVELALEVLQKHGVQYTCSVKNN